MKKETLKAGETVINICFSDIKPTVKGLQLNIGSGDGHADGFINVDRYNPNADAPWAADCLELNDCSVSLITCWQTFEHFDYQDVPSIVSEWFRVCKQGGQVHLNTPDIVESCRLVVENPDKQWMLARIFGNQSHGGQYHKWGYTIAQLTNLFGLAGFGSVVCAHYKNEDGTTFLYLKAVR